MTDATATFEKISNTDNPLYGARKLLLCGFSGKAQHNFLSLLQMTKFPETHVVFVTKDLAKLKISEIIEMPDRTGLDRTSDFSRAIIVSGITENELHFLMNVTKQSGMKQTLWAIVTQTSENWTIPQLLSELSIEHKIMSKKNR